MTFYHCEHCGNIIVFAHNSGVPVVCCGEKMKELVPGTVDASKEKHVPVIERDGASVLVKVGTVPHPMVEEHYIGWIVMETNKGHQYQLLDHTGAPEARFALNEGEDVVAAYAWCNLHGLWKA